MFSVVGLMILLVAVFGATAQTALIFWFLGKLKKLEEASPDRELLNRLVEQVELLGEQTEDAREEMAELQERIDFAERLLTKPEDTPA